MPSSARNPGDEPAPASDDPVPWHDRWSQLVFGPLCVGSAIGLYELGGLPQSWNVVDSAPPLLAFGLLVTGLMLLASPGKLPHDGDDARRPATLPVAIPAAASRRRADLRRRPEHKQLVDRLRGCGE